MMFLKSHVELAVDFDSVRAAMLRRPDVWLGGLIEAAERDCARLLAACHLEAAGCSPARLDVGQPVTTDRVASLPLRLRGGDPRPLAAEGSLDAAWLGPGRTHLALAAQYEAGGALSWPPADRALVHRIAETVASRFLLTVAARLATCAGGQPSGTWAVPSPTSASKWRTSP